MPKSIAEIRASGKVRRRTIDHTICLDSDLADRYREVRDELMQMTADFEAGVRQDPSQKARLGSRPRVTRADLETKGAELDAIADEMAEFEVTVTIARSEPGEWNRWAIEHPPREQEPDEAGRRALVIRDAVHGGRVDFDALVEELPGWVTAVNGQDASDDDWAWLVSLASPRELDDLADAVLKLHTGEVASVPKSLMTSLSTLLDAIDSKQPEPGT